MHGDERVELEHCGARERDEGGESLSKVESGNWADGVDVTKDNFLETGGRLLEYTWRVNRLSSYLRMTRVSRLRRGGCFEDVRATRLEYIPGLKLANQ